MTEREQKAIKWIKNVRDDAVVTLDHIVKNEPNVRPTLYAGRKEKAEVILNAFEELERYRALGTVEDIKKIIAFLSLDGEKISRVLQIKQTNADRIRSMSDEELAEFIVGLNDCCLAGMGLCDCSEELPHCSEICASKTKKWLQSEMEG